MSAWTGIFSALDDRMNPIVVKELRQAVAGKFVASVLMLFLTVQLATLGLFLMLDDTSGAASDFDTGRSVFMVLSAILLGTCLLFVPAYAALRLSAERSDTQVDLLYVTTIRPRSIIWGKFASAMMVTILIYSACLPFISLTYLLRGIDLPTIFVLLGIDFLIIAASNMFAIFLACIPANRVIKSMLALVGLGVLISVFSGTIGTTSSLLFFGGGIGASGFWQVVAVFSVLTVALTGLMFVVSVAMVSPPSANRAIIVRTYLTVVWLIIGGYMLIWSTIITDHGPVLAWLIITVIIGCATMLVSVSERDTWGARLRGMIPRNFVLRRLAFMFYSGASGGVAWTVITVGATVAVAWWWGVNFSSFGSHGDLNECLDTCTPMMLYFFAYSMTAMLIRRRLLSTWITPNNTYALALILMAIGTVAPLAIGWIVSGQSFYRMPAEYYLTMPFVMFVNDHVRETAWWFAGVWAGGIAVMSLPWFFARTRQFQPLASEPAATAEAGPETVNTDA